MMPRTARTAALLVLGTMPAGLHLAGCFPFPLHEDCTHKPLECGENQGGAGGAGGVAVGGTGGAAGTGGATGTGGAAGTGGTGGEPTPLGCVPSDERGWAADETCGVFVSATAIDGGDGTRAAPVKTLAQAIQLAAQKEDETERRVYACAETFEETLTVTSGVTIFGGLDCEANWQWEEGKKTILTASSGVVPLTMRAGGETVHLEDVHVLAPSIDPDDAGTSAIAAIAELCEVDMVRCIFEAGHAAPGDAGASAPAQPEQVPRGDQGNAACSDEVVDTVAPQPNDCGTADPSTGGRGGPGNEDRGKAGASGSPGADANPNAGSYDATLGTCTRGEVGRDGDPGEPGPGASGIGQLSSTGYVGASGRGGQSGKTAQGGGGGGGSRGSIACPGSNNGGASGGNGGAGGCGGAGGKGGSPGGSSIALLSLNAKLTFQDVRLIAGDGGKGGNGSAGQTGGLGGWGGLGGAGSLTHDVLSACNGGAGGQGGTGGRGGGGQGGHSLGIAFRGTPDTLPSLDGVRVQLGAFGAGGTGSDDEHNGDAGQASNLLDFSSPQRAPAP
ncbi:hypothetical protein WME99_49340 [Sorangium sp. So ce136]|uniref:hypothetical protein n=1 Tax=Sorangium sp. So ce136 TaxID=3133284 RepID=UPI003F02F510